jgi:hypothetical protein
MYQNNSNFNIINELNRKYKFHTVFVDNQITIIFIKKSEYLEVIKTYIHEILFLIFVFM